MAYWLVKTEPGDYSLADLASEGTTVWDGVKNALALKHMRRMQPGDEVLVYHSGRKPTVVGLAKVVTSTYEVEETGETVFDLAYQATFAVPIPLSAVKAEPRYGEWELVRLPRLSVMSVPPDIFVELRRVGEGGEGKGGDVN